MKTVQKWPHIETENTSYFIKRIYTSMNNAKINKSNNMFEYGINLAD